MTNNSELFAPLDPLMTEAEVLKATTLGRTKFRELVRAGEFEPPRQISICRVAWRRSAVQSWIDARPIADAYQDSTYQRPVDPEQQPSTSE